MITAPVCPTSTITVAMPSTLYQTAGANQANTYYNGLSAALPVTANPVGTAGPFTYNWTNSGGFTFSNNTSKTSYLYMPTAASWMKVTITDVGTNCTVKDSVFVNFVDYTCPPQPGMLWWYQLCNTQTQTTVCVQRTANMRTLLQTGNYVFGPCSSNPPKRELANDNSIGLSVYPNPSNGNIAYNFTSGDATNFETHVLDLNGRVLFSESFVCESEMTIRELDLSTFAAGMYLINVTGNNQTFTERIIIQ